MLAGGTLPTCPSSPWPTWGPVCPARDQSEDHQSPALYQERCRGHFYTLSTELKLRLSALAHHPCPGYLFPFAYPTTVPLPCYSHIDAMRHRVHQGNHPTLGPLAWMVVTFSCALAQWQRICF